MVRLSTPRIGGTFVLSLATALLLTAAPVSAATRPITFNMSLGSNRIGGTASDGSTVELRWRDGAGHLKAQATLTASSWGSWFFSGPTNVSVEPGDRLRASDGHSTRTMIVPSLWAVANRVKNVFKGEAPAGSRLFLECTYPGRPVPDVACERERLRVNDEGRWFHRPGWNIRGGDGALFSWFSAEGDEVSFSAEAPFVVVTLGMARVEGLSRANADVEISLKNVATHAVLGTFSGQAGPGQDFRGSFRNSSGDPVSVMPGQRLVADIASDAAFTVPQIEATGDVETDTVSGWCEDTGRSDHEVYIRVLRSGHWRGFAITGTEADGTFSQDMTQVSFPDPSVIKHGDRLLITCVQKNRDMVQRWIPVP